MGASGQRRRGNGFPGPVRPLETQFRPTVLVVEDDEDQRELLTFVLVQNGYDVAGAADGRQALEWLREIAAPGLVLLDLILPNVDGWQVRREMLEDEELAAVPVVCISAKEGLATIAAELRAAAYIRKPQRLNVVLQVVDQHCELPGY